MISDCLQDDPQNGRNCHYVIGGLDGTGHVIISVGIFVIGNESIGQTKVEFYCVPCIHGRVRILRHRNTEFRDGNVMGTTTFGGGGVTVWSASLFIVG